AALMGKYKEFSQPGSARMPVMCGCGDGVRLTPVPNTNTRVWMIAIGTSLSRSLSRAQLAFDELAAMRFEPLVHVFLARSHQTRLAHHMAAKYRGEAADIPHLGALISHTNLPSNCPKAHSDVNRASSLEDPSGAVNHTDREGAPSPCQKACQHR